MKFPILHHNKRFIASYIIHFQNKTHLSRQTSAMLWARFFFLAAQLGSALGKEQAVLTSSRHELDAIREKYGQFSFNQNVSLT
jgi:hypothetical protein